MGLDGVGGVSFRRGRRVPARALLTPWGRWGSRDLFSSGLRLQSGQSEIEGGRPRASMRPAAMVAVVPRFGPRGLYLG